MDDFYWSLKVQPGKKKYNPDQPRVPAGDPQGGQWTSGGEGSTPQAEDKPKLQGAPDGSAYDFVAGKRGMGTGKIPKGSILTPADGSPPFRVERSNGFVISGLEIGRRGMPRDARIDLRITDAGLDLSGSF